MIKEKFTDVQIKYVYIKSFEWSDQMLSEVYSGHPHVNKVYRAVFNPNTNNYKLNVPGTIDMILFEKLSETTPAFKSELVELTKFNVTTLNLSEESLDQILNWNQSGHKDIEEMYGERNEDLPVKIQLRLQSMHDEQMEFAKEVVEVFSSLDNINSIQAVILLGVARSLIQINLEEHEQDSLKYSENLGMGTNISAAIKHLQTYYSTDRRTNEDEDDLYCAITHLVEEINRRILLED